MATIPLYFSTTAKDDNSGLYFMRFDSETGTAAEAARPVGSQASSLFFTGSQDGRFLYAIDDGLLHNGEKTGGISAYAIDEKTGELTLLNSVVMGGVLCHVSLDASGKWLLGAAYTGGNFAIWPIQEDGSLGPVHQNVQHEGQSADSRRQSAPHPHQIITSPDNQQVFVADLGTDKVMIYDFDAESGKLSAADPDSAELAPGAGPRHIAFHPSGDSFFSVNELDNTVTVFRKENGKFTAIQAVPTLPEGVSEPTWTAEILISSNGQFVYATNRGHQSIAVYQVNDDRSLTSLGFTATGRFPQHIAFSPCEKWLLSADRDDSSITVFSVNTLTGTLTKIEVFDNLPGAPMCLLFP